MLASLHIRVFGLSWAPFAFRLRGQSLWTKATMQRHHDNNPRGAHHLARHTPTAGKLQFI